MGVILTIKFTLCLVQMMACIGEQFTEGDEICGIVVNVRARQDRLCMWTKTASNEAAQVGCLPAVFGQISSIILPYSAAAWWGWRHGYNLL